MKNFQNKNISHYDYIEELHNAFDHFKKENDIRLESIEKKQSIDPLLEEKINKIHSHLDILEKENLLSQRPNNLIKNNNIDTCFSNKNEEMDYKYFLEYIKKGNYSDLENFRKNNFQTKSGETILGSTSTSGAFLINNFLYTKIMNKITSQSVLRRFGNVMNVSSDLNEFIQCFEDAENSGWIDELEDRLQTTTPKISKITIRLHEIYSNPKISQRLLMDSVLNIENWIIDKIANSFRMTENQAFLFGNGDKRPLGILAYNSDPNTSIKIGEFNVANSKVNPSASKNLNLDNLLGIIYSLEEHYLENASWIMSPNCLRVIRGLKDSTSGIYLWQPAFEKSSPSSLLGYPIGLSRELPNGDKEGDTPIIFGDFKEAFLILDSTKNIFIRDQYSSKGFVTFYINKRIGASIVNPNALKIMKIIAPI